MAGIFKLRNITDLLKMFYPTSFHPFYIYSLLLICGPKVLKNETTNIMFVLHTSCPHIRLIFLKFFPVTNIVQIFSGYSALQSRTD